jgi:hypothetical protein
MNKKLSRITLLCVICLGSGSFAQAQSEFDNAHFLLLRLAEENSAAKTAVAKAQLQKELKTIPPDVSKLVNLGLLNLLNNGLVRSPEDLRVKIDEALETGNVTPAFVFPLQNRSYVIIYNVLFCSTCSRSWIGMFSPQGGKYAIVASLEDSLPDQSIRAVSLSASDNGTRFIVYGTNWGDAHNRLSVVAYLVEGDKVRDFWSRSGLPQGAAQIGEGMMELSFFTSLRPPWTRRKETYSLGRESIRLQSVSENPEN